jgi:hypothetical protein
MNLISNLPCSTDLVMESQGNITTCVGEEFLEQASALQKLAIDVSDIETAATQLAGVRNVYETIPDDVLALKQFAPVVAIYNSKLSALRNRIRDAFEQAIEMSGPADWLHVHHEIYELDKLWSSAIKVNYEGAILRRLSERLGLTILKTLLGILSDRTPLSVSIEGSRWRYRTDARQSQTWTDSILSLFTFIKSEVFDDSLIGSSLYKRFLRICWGPFARDILRRCNNEPSEDLCALETSLLSIYESEDRPKSILTDTQSRVELDKLQRQANSMLEALRTRILQDSLNTLTKTPVPPNKDMIDEEGFYPSLVSETCMWLVSNCLCESVEATIIPSVVALFVLMRRPEFSDPEAINARNLAVFFQDASYICLCLATRASKTNNNTDRKILKDQIAISRACVVKSVEYFTKKMMNRFKSRIELAAPRSFSLGLVTSEQENIADECIESSLVELAKCSREWNMTVKMHKRVANLWTVTLADMFLKYMNTVAQSVASIACDRQASSSALWGVWNRFISSVEMLGNLACFNSYKSAKKIQLALSGTAHDINASVDPIPEDEQLFGVSAIGLEKLLACNPLLRRESKTVIASLVNKIIVSMNPTRSKVNDSASPRQYSALFG